MGIASNTADGINSPDEGPELADVAPYQALPTLVAGMRAASTVTAAARDMREPATKPGATTSEFAEVQSAGALAHAATLLGTLAAIGSTIAAALGENTRLGIIAGAVVTVAGVVARTLIALGYTKSRTDVKAAAMSRGTQG